MNLKYQMLASSIQMGVMEFLMYVVIIPQILILVLQGFQLF